MKMARKNLQRVAALLDKCEAAGIQPSPVRLVTPERDDTSRAFVLILENLKLSEN